MVHSKIANYNHPDTPELDDFGDATLVADNGATGYFRVDWFTPDGLSTWGRRPHLHLGHRWLHRAAQVRGPGPQHRGEPRLLGGQGGRALLQRHGQDGASPSFGQLVLDCIHRTENAMTQEHALKAAELCVRAQLQAEDLSHRG